MSDTAAGSATGIVPARDAITAGLVRLSEWATSAAAQPIPGQTLAKAARVFVDDVAAMCAAFSQPEISAMHRAALQSGLAQAVLFTPGAPRVDRHAAAIANGTAGCWCELDEGFRGAPCHGGLYVLPALLAESESRDLTLGNVLRALAISYEVCARIAEAWTFPGISVHPHAAFANFGAVAGAALATGATASDLASALRIVGGMVPAGAYQAAVEGALVRNLWTGQAASTGMWAVSWAQAGLDGYPDGPHPAFTGLFGATTRPEKLTQDLGTRWAIEGGYHKLHGCCHSTHAAVESALAMRGQIDVASALDGIAAIRLYTHRPAMGNKAPANSLAARFSFEHVVAVSLALGHTRPQAFEPAAIDAPIVSALRQRIELLPYDPLPAWPLDRPARLEITLKNGRVLVSECLSAPGGPDQPLTNAQILHKVTGLTRDAYPGFGVVAERVLSLDAALMSRPWREVVQQWLAQND